MSDSLRPSRRSDLGSRPGYEVDGYKGLFDRRREPSPKRVPVETVRQVLQLYREQYADCNVQHFHELLRERHGITLSYSA